MHLCVVETHQKQSTSQARTSSVPMTALKAMKDSKQDVVMDCCSRIEVEENGSKVVKQCVPPLAAINKSKIYFGGAKWVIKKLKDLTFICLGDDEMILKTDKLSIKILREPCPTEEMNDQWERFRNKIQRSYDRFHHVDSGRKVFGSSKSKKSSKLIASASAMPWDEEAPLVSTKKRRKFKFQSKTPEDGDYFDFVEEDNSTEIEHETNESVPVEESLNTSPHSTSSEDQHQTNDEDEIRREYVPVGKRLKKLFDSKAKESEDTDDDEEMFGNAGDLTTPAARRIVSPGTHSAVAEDGGADADEGPPQTQIDSFFKVKTTSPCAPSTPPPYSWKKATDPTVGGRSTASKYWQRKSFSSAKTPVLFSSQSPTRPSVSERRGGELFGSSAKRRRSIEEQDPIEEDASTPPHIVRRVQRPKLGQGTTRRMHFDLVPRDELPNRPRFRGLENLGNTCYLNASIQMLFSCNAFMDALANHNKSALTDGLISLYKELQVKNARPVSPIAIKNAIDAKTNKFRGFLQRDAHEFLADLIDHVHDEIAPSNVENPPENPSPPKGLVPTDDFCCRVKATLSCTKCGYARDKEEMYRCLSIDIVTDENTTKASVEKCVAGFFAPEEREVDCEKCKEGTHATQTLQIVSKSKYLLLHLKRFIFLEQPISMAATENQEPNNTSTGHVSYVLRKNKAPVAIQPRLNLDPFVASNDAGQKDQIGGYKLRSVVHHLGNQASSGHYTAQAIRGEDWLTFDDRNSGYTSLEQITNEPSRASSAYLLLYELSPTIEAGCKPASSEAAGSNSDPKGPVAKSCSI